MSELDKCVETDSGPNVLFINNGDMISNVYPHGNNETNRTLLPKNACERSE